MGIYDREYYRDSQTPGMFSTSPRLLVTNLVIINAVLFFGDLFFGGRDHWLTNHLLIGADTVPQPWLWWKFLTCGFAHLNFEHLLWNMLGLWMFGREVEAVYGRAEFLRIYLVALLTGSLIWGLRSYLQHGPDPSLKMLGASGAVTAIVLLFVFHYPRQTILLFMILPVPAWVLGILIIGGDLLRLNAASGPVQVAYDVHLAGVAFAACYYYFGWNFSWLSWHLDGLRWPRLPRPKRPSLKIHDPGEPSPLESEQEEEEDRVLQKVSREGLASLTAEERTTLENYSRRMRQKYHA